MDAVTDMSEKDKKKKKLSRSGKVILDILLVCAIGTAAFSGFQLITIWNNYRAARETYDKVRQAAIKETADPQASADPYDPGIDWDALKAINPDMAGWIRLDGTVVDYPFVYASDDEYYLEHLFDGTVKHSGTVFVDADNQQNFQDKNTLLYAHNMKDGSMFASISEYKNQDFYNEHKIIKIWTPDAYYELHPLGGIITDGWDTYVQTTFASDDAFMDYVNYFVSNSTFKSEDSVSAEDQTVVLSTCNYHKNNGRYALLCKLAKVHEFSK